MSLLFNLPEDVSYLIVAEWLRLVNYGYLDIALHLSDKTSWYRLLNRLPKVRIGKGTTARMPVRLSRWCYSRNVILEDITISDFWFNKNGSLKGPLKWGEVNQLNIVCTKRKQMKKINETVSKYCNKLNGLSVLSANAIMLLSPTIESRLTSLNINQINSLKAIEVLTRISMYCQLLRNLSIDFNNSNNTYTDLCSVIVITNPNLEFIQLPAELDIAVSLTHFCKSIETVILLKAEWQFPRFEALCSLSTVKVVETRNLQYRLESKKKTLRLVEIEPTLPQLDIFLFSLHGYSGLQFVSCLLTEVQMSTVIQQSLNTLEELSLPAFNTLSTTTRNVILQCSRLTSLKWNETNGDILELFRPSFTLTKLQYVGIGVNLVKIMSIIHCFPHLESCCFGRVTERRDDILAFKEFMYRFGSSFPKFRCELIMTGKMLKYKNGRFGGVNVEEYLSELEVELMFDDPWYLTEMSE